MIHNCIERLKGRINTVETDSLIRMTVIITHSYILRVVLVIIMEFHWFIRRIL